MQKILTGEPDRSDREIQKSRAFGAVRWAAIGSFGRSLLAFGQLFVLSRLIAPSEFGSIALIITLLATISAIADAGLSSALIRFQDADNEEKSSLFWLNVAIGAMMTIILFASAGAIAKFYESQDLDRLLKIVCFILLINSAGLQLRVLAERELLLRKLVAIELVSSFVGASVSIALAVWAFGALAVAIGQITSSLMLLLLTWLVLANNWPPSIMFRPAKAARFFSYGRDMFLVNVAIAASVNIDVLVAGKLLPLHTLAYFSQPRDLCMKIMQTVNPIITRVGLPVMARYQSDRSKVSGIYLSTIRMTASVTMPIYAFIALLSAPIVSVVLGPAWASSASLLPTIALWFLLRSFINPIWSLLYAIFESGAAVTYQLIMLTILAVAVAVGAVCGIEFIAPALVVAHVLLVEFNWRFILKRLCGVGFYDFHKNIVPPIVCTSITLAVAAPLVGVIDGDIRKILSALLVGVTVYIASSAIINRSFIDSIMHLLNMRAQA